MGTQYCFPTDLTSTGVNPLALQDVPIAQQTQGCIDASALADSYMRGRYALPLLAFGRDIVYRVSQLAVYLILSSRGYSPEGGDKRIKDNYDESIAWFEEVQRQSVHPNVTPSVTQPGDPVYDLPQVKTQPQRGWPNLGRGGLPSV